MFRGSKHGFTYAVHALAVEGNHRMGGISHDYHAVLVVVRGTLKKWKWLYNLSRCYFKNKNVF